MTTAEPEYAPLHDEFETDVLPVRRRPRVPLVTTALVLAAVAAGAFVGGVEIQKHFGAATASAATAGGTGGAGGRFARAASGRAGGASAGAAPGGFGGFGGAAGNNSVTTGLVTLIKGSTLYVTDFSGNTIKVTTAKSVPVTKTVASSVKGIHPGDSVVVTSTKQKDGTYRARSVTIQTGNG